MNLHKDKTAFNEYIDDTTSFMGLENEMQSAIEKDYFVTLFLKSFAEKQPDLVFKGGTSLLKCHKIIERFSEDIDLNVNANERAKSGKPSESQRRNLKKAILEVIDELGFSLENADRVRSRRDFNKYIVNYNPSELNSYLKEFLIVETSVFVKSFPTETMPVASFIHDFMLAKGVEDEIKKYGLEPFPVRVQSLERTFIDKVFAISDYVLTNKIKEHSRHIYDLYKLYPKITFNNEFTELVGEVRAVRKEHVSCLSAQDGVDVVEILQKIKDEDLYKSDYNDITDALLFEKVPYSQAIMVIQRILEDGCFVRN